MKTVHINFIYSGYEGPSVHDFYCTPDRIVLHHVNRDHGLGDVYEITIPDGSTLSIDEADYNRIAKILMEG